MSHASISAALIPTWASTVGKDRAGTWAKLAVGDQTQVMRLIPAGTFQMGSKNNRDKLVRQVTISQPFWLGDSEVTQDLWLTVMGSNPSKFPGTAEPVEQVTWNDCQGFVQKLNGQIQGLRACLPTEAQWEYACRAGTTGDYAGDLGALGWYDRNVDGRIHPVKMKRANAFGLYDMHGNVSEWCEDWYGPYAEGAQRDPTGPSSGSERVNKGGNGNADASACRSASRGSAPPDSRSMFLGFRFAAQALP